MNLNELRARIENKTAKLAVIGQGYVGLPVAALFANAGFDVLGVDLRRALVEKINAGINPIEGKEPGWQNYCKLLLCLAASVLQPITTS
ncbi:MAG: 3-hydroxyacyl-CoA dehydrogenase NAD-binding domain-containing protein [Anaerolineales bacterium]